MRGLTNQFGLISTIGLLPLQWSTALNNYLVAQKIVAPQMFAGIFVLGCNVGFNYLFVYGVPSLGWSGLGFAGSGPGNPRVKSTVRFWTQHVSANVCEWDKASQA